MSKPLSVDCQERVVAAVDGWLSRRKGGAVGASISSAIRWTAQMRQTGDVQPLRPGGDKQSGRSKPRVLRSWMRSRRSQGITGGAA